MFRSYGINLSLLLILSHHPVIYGVQFDNVTVCYLSGYAEVSCEHNKSGDSLNDLVSKNDVEQTSGKPINYLVIKDGNVAQLSENSISNQTSDALPHLEGLLLVNLRIRNIAPGAFSSLRNFSINIGGNNLQKIDKDIFANVPGIRELFLSNNKISSIHERAFDNMPDLRHIDLSHNNLKEWNPNWLTGSPINVLHVSFNQIEQLPPNAFKFLNTSPNNGSLLRIDFSNNKLSELNRETFEDIQRIDNMDMAHNSIHSIDKNIFENMEIREFYIQENQLVCIPEEHYEDIFKAKLTAIFSNPWDKECFDAMVKWSDENGGKLLHPRYKF